MPATPDLTALTEADLSGLEEWASPFATMTESRALSAWGERAWQAAVDEQRRRIDGFKATPWPRMTQLSNEELVLISQPLAALHRIGSFALTRFVETLTEELTGILADRAIRKTGT